MIPLPQLVSVVVSAAAAASADEAQRSTAAMSALINSANFQFILHCKANSEFIVYESVFRNLFICLFGL